MKMLSEGPKKTENIISVENLSVGIPGRKTIVKNVGFSLKKGETIGIAGESGSGKTLTALAISGLLPPPLRILSGAVRFKGTDISRNYRSPGFNRGRDILFLFQSPSGALNPTVRTGIQLLHPIRAHFNLTVRQARLKTLSAMESVGLEEADYKRYPFQLSGGQRQRALMALAFGLRPHLLIADEPTTGQDDINRELIMMLLGKLRKEAGTGQIVISHDLRVLTRLSGSIMVMYRGIPAESGSPSEITERPRHPHSIELVESMRYLEGVT